MNEQEPMHTSWESVKERVSEYGSERIIATANFHIKGLHWFADRLADCVVEWPRQLLLDIIAYAVLDDSKVSFDEHLDLVKRIASGKDQLEFRGVMFPVDQSMRAANLFLNSHENILKQYDEIQATIMRDRKEQKQKDKGT